MLNYTNLSFFRLFYSFGSHKFNPNPGAVAEPTPTRRGGADQDTLSRRYSEDARPASAPPVDAGPVLC